MNPTKVGILTGGVLGVLDGLSAWFYPEARPMIAAIVVGSTIKGILTGIAAMGILAWAAWGPGLRALRLVERTGSAFNSPSPAIIKPLIAIGAALIVLQLLVQVLRHLTGRPAPQSPDNEC